MNGETIRSVSYRFLAVFLAVLVSSSVFFVRPAHAANFGMRVGYYVGTGASKTVSGLGFRPDFVIIKSATGAGVGVFKTSAMAANATAFLSTTADNTATNISFTVDGFTVGTLANVNTANVLYRWVAFSGSDCSASGYFCVGTYTGNGTSPRTIITGFQPDMAIVKRSTTGGAHFRTTSMSVDQAEYFTSTLGDYAGGLVADFSTTGFSVGATDNAAGGIYYYVVFRAGASSFSEGTYVGDGADNRSITGAGFQPDMVVIKNSDSFTANNRRAVLSGDKHFGDHASYTGDAVADAVDTIQAMQPDGFQVGTAVGANESGATMYWFSFGGAPSMGTASGSFSMAQGSYTGSGAARSITGIGFAPDLVIIKDNAANYAVFRIRQMAGDTTAYFAVATADFAGGITSLGPDGFSLGTSAIVNTLNNVYHWQAFGNAYNPDTNSGSADFATGAYYGNGIDNRNIADLPFQPDLVAVKRAGATAGAFRTSAHTGDISSFFAATADAANVVQTLTAGTFQIGTSGAVNTSASVYRWFAFKAGTNFSVGAYTGTGVTSLQVSAPFWSDAIWVKRSTAVAAVQRPSTLAGTASQAFLNTANVTTAITGINASGFTVGNATSVNTAAGVYRYTVWRVPPTGALSVDIVDGSGQSIAAPSLGFSSVHMGFNCTENTATLGASTQMIRVTNMSANGSWVLAIAPTDGATARWHNGDSSAHFDFNDTAGSPAGCSDGPDADTDAGKLSIQPSVATIAPQAGCSQTAMSRGADLDYQDGVTNSVTLISTVSGANTECYWDLTGFTLRQMIPAEQPPSAYTLGLTVTIISQ